MTRIDPEQPKPLDDIWRKLYCIQYMKKGNWWSSIATDQQFEDSGYCLDRNVLSYPLTKDN